MVGREDVTIFDLPNHQTVRCVKGKISSSGIMTDDSNARRIAPVLIFPHRETVGPVDG